MALKKIDWNANITTLSSSSSSNNNSNNNNTSNSSNIIGNISVVPFLVFSSVFNS